MSSNKNDSYYDDQVSVESDTKMNIDNTPSTTNIIKKGRGFKIASSNRYSDGVNSNQFDVYSNNTNNTIQTNSEGGAQRSIEGWILIVTNLHPETSEEDVMEKFQDSGKIKNLHLNLDRKTGYVKGYALIEYETYREAKNTIQNMDNTDILGHTIRCDFAFVRPSSNNAAANSRKNAENINERRNHRNRRNRYGSRSVSPRR